MAITVTDLTTLDQTLVQQNLDTILSMVRALNPDITLESGPIKSIVLQISAILAAANQTGINKLLRASSLLKINADPTLADSDVLAALASNYRITPKAGAAATGSITIVISKNVSTVISNSTIFTANANTSSSQQFSLSQTYVGRTSASDVISTNDVLITAVGDGTYSFTISATATTVGVLGNIPRGTALTFANPPTNFVKAYASTDFTGGQAAENNVQLQNRLQSGIASQTVSNRVSTDSVLKTAYPSTSYTSIIGYGDSEQTRYHSVFPVKFGGRVDVYTRSAPLWLSVVLPSVSASLVSKNNNNRGTWQFSVARDQAPGFYEVQSITQTAGSALFGTNYAVTSDIRGYDLTINTGASATPSTTWMPDITSATEAAYSRYQTATVQFLDTDTDVTNTSIGATANYAVSLKALPNILGSQDIVSARAMRDTGGDCLLKAAVPCFVSVGVTINVNQNTTSPDLPTVKSAVANSINSTGFVGSISAANVSAAIAAVIPSTSAVSAITLNGRLRKCDGTNVNLISSSLLSFTDDATTFSTSKTVCFFCNTADIAVSLVTVTPPAV